MSTDVTRDNLEVQSIKSEVVRLFLDNGYKEVDVLMSGGSDIALVNSSGDLVRIYSVEGDCEITVMGSDLQARMHFGAVDKNDKNPEDVLNTSGKFHLGNKMTTGGATGDCFSIEMGPYDNSLAGKFRRGLKEVVGYIRD